MNVRIDASTPLVERFGSPLYVYDLDDVEARVRELQQVLPSGSRLLYSLKANPLPALVHTALRAGCGAEVSSDGELKVALQGIAQVGARASEQLVYSGPGKTRAEMHAAIAAGVNVFSVESFADLARLNDEARHFGVTVKVLLRINPDMPATSGLSMAGVATQFGFEERELLDGAALIVALGSHVEVVGTHTYFGSQFSGVPQLHAAFSAGIQAAERVCAALQIDPEMIDLGGGFPWPYAHDAAPIDLGELGQELARLSASRERTRNAQLYFESGRYVSASSGRLYTTVLDVKQSKHEKRFVVLDAGINLLGGMSGLGRIPRGNISFNCDRWADDAARSPIAVVGPLCSPLDCLAPAATLPELKVGDVISVPNVGAYGLTASLLGFLSRPPPAEVAVRGGDLVAAYKLRSGHDGLPTERDT